MSEYTIRNGALFSALVLSFFLASGCSHLMQPKSFSNGGNTLAESAVDPSSTSPTSGPVLLDSEQLNSRSFRFTVTNASNKTIFAGFTKRDSTVVDDFVYGLEGDSLTNRNDEPSANRHTVPMINPIASGERVSFDVEISKPGRYKIVVPYLTDENVAEKLNDVERMFNRSTDESREIRAKWREVRSQEFFVK